MTETQIHNLVNMLGKVKDLKRGGWIRRNVVNPESDAEHMFSVALEVLFLAPPHLDRCHCLELALTHDLPEIYATDILPGQMPLDEKYEKEKAAAKKLAEELDFPQLLQWFEEFETESSPEARFVKCLDRMDNGVTAAYYERENRSGQPVLEEFSSRAKQLIGQSSCAERDICLNLLNIITKQ